VLEAVALALGGRAGARLLDSPGHADFSEDTHRVLETPSQLPAMPMWPA
jgi:translation elongation factor EF-G